MAGTREPTHKGHSTEGLRIMKGGEELRRATAALQAGTLASPAMTSGHFQVEGLAGHGEAAANLPVSLPDRADSGLKEMAAAVQRYAQAASETPEDYDAVYNHGLALQELATRLGTSQADQLTLLSQAGTCYEAAVRLRPASHAALYNWGVALSDMARVQRTTDPAAATDRLISAADKYSASLQWNPQHPQALNNWGLVLQELATTRPPAERPRLVRHAVSKFRHAMRQRPEFDRACYNLGTVFYAHACQLQHAAQQHLSSQLTQDAEAQAQEARQEGLIRHAFAMAAQYIALAQVLQPTREVYQRSLGVIQPLLPLPYLRTGWLQAVNPASELFEERWDRYYFVLDQDSFRSVHASESLQETTPLGHDASGLRQLPHAANGVSEPLHRVLLAEVVQARTCSDVSLPHGHGLWVGQRSRPEGTFYVSESSSDAEGWADALMLVAHLAVTHQVDALQHALTPLPKRHTRSVPPS